MQVCPGYPPDRKGGIENIVNAIHTSLEDMDFDSYVLTRYYRVEVQERKVIQLRTPKSEGPGYFIWTINAFRVLRKLKPDIVHCHGLEGAILCTVMYPFKVKKIMHLHNSISREKDFYRKITHRLGLIMLKQAVKSADIIICPTLASLQDLADNISKDIFRKSVVIPNFARYPSLVTKDQIESLKRFYGISDKRVILYFGKIKASKGIEYICRAYELMKLKSETTLILAGMPTATDRFFNKIKQKYPSAILTGYVPDPSPVYYLADLFCIYTDSFEGGEVFSIALADAMMHGIPVIASENKIFREVTNGFAIFVKPKDEEELAKAFDLALTNMEMTKEKALKAKIFAQSNYTKEKFLRRMISVYRWVIRAKVAY